MVSTFTTNLNIELPGHNDYVGTWDTPTNANWSLVDNMAGGSLLLNATGLSGTIALTNIQLQPRTIQITGAPSGAITYRVPSGVGGQWIVRNTTTGGQTVGVVSQAGGSTVTIPANLILPMWCNGTATGMLIGNSVLDSSGVHFPDGTTQTTASNSPPLTGVIFPYAGTTAPSWALLCNGQAVSRAIYSALNTLMSGLGYPYGSGDGSTTFNVPDLRGRTVFGNDVMGASAAGRVTAGGSGINGSSQGASGGAQSETAGISGATAGSLSVSTVSFAMNGPNLLHNASDQAINTFNAAADNHTHANVLSTGNTSGSLSVTGTTNTVTNMPPTLICSWIIGT